MLTISQAVFKKNCFLTRHILVNLCPEACGKFS